MGEIIMNIIFRFADLEINDLSKLDSVDASPEAKQVIRQAQQTAAYWQSRFTINAINKEQVPYGRKLEMLNEIKQELQDQL